MLQWVSRLSRHLVRHGPHRPSVLGPDEIPLDEVELTAGGTEGPQGPVIVALTRKRLLLTNAADTRETLSISLTRVTELEATPAGIRVAYRDADGVERELWLGHIPDAMKRDQVWMGDDAWVQSVAAHILEETGRDVWRESTSPTYIRGA